jgi:chemotaxis protein histidine kinase CheA
MDRRSYQQMFVEVDGPIAEQLSASLQNLTVDAEHARWDAASLLCHRLRGDARTVGFVALGELIGSIEDRLRHSLRSGVAVEADCLDSMRRAAEEIVTRMKSGEAACGEPLEGEWTALVAQLQAACTVAVATPPVGAPGESDV